MKYNYEELEKEIMKELYVSKDDSSLMVALYDQKVDLYPLTFDGENPKLVEDIGNSFLLFFNTVCNNENFDLTNFRANLNKNLVIGVWQKNVLPDSGTTIYNENKNLFGIFADFNLVSRGVIFHELFHYAFRGDKNNMFGRGLNEGYTEALTHRYFQKSKLAYKEVPQLDLYALAHTK